MTLQEINKIDPLDIKATYVVGKYTVFFDPKEWTWRAKNPFGFGVDSDLSLVLLLKRLIEE
jgi:hypothetical protein